MIWHGCRRSFFAHSFGSASAFTLYTLAERAADGQRREAFRAFLKPETTVWSRPRAFPDPTAVSPDGHSLDKFYLTPPGVLQVKLRPVRRSPSSSRRFIRSNPLLIESVHRIRLCRRVKRTGNRIMNLGFPYQRVVNSSRLAIHSRTTGDLRRGPQMTRCIKGVPCLPLFLQSMP